MPDHAAVSLDDAPVTLSPRTREILLVLACPLFMVNFDGSAVATALPSMAQAFGCDPQRMSIALTAMLVSVAVVVPASGWVADRFGARNVLCAAIAVFVCGSILCGHADSLGMMVLARCLQGMGAALMVPVGRILLIRGASRREIAVALAWQSPPSLLAILVGPPLAGWIVTHAGWRWLFDVHLVAGAVGIALATRYLSRDPLPEPEPLDRRGLLLAGLAFAGLMFGLETLGRGIVPWWLVLGMLLLGAGAAAGYIWHLRRIVAPVLDLRLFRLPCFRGVFAASMLYRSGNGALPFLLPMTLQLGLGWTAWEAGLVLIVSAIGGLPVGPLLGPLLRRVGFRATVGCVAVLSAIVFSLCAALDASWPTMAVCAVLLAWGLLSEVQVSAYASLAYDDVPPDRMTAATGLAYAGSRLAQAIGIALAAAAMDVAATLAGGGAATSGLAAAFLLVGVLALAAAPFSWRLPAGAGDELTGRQAARPAE